MKSLSSQLSHHDNSFLLIWTANSSVEPKNLLWHWEEVFAKLRRVRTADNNKSPEVMLFRADLYTRAQQQTAVAEGGTRLCYQTWTRQARETPKFCCMLPHSCSRSARSARRVTITNHAVRPHASACAEQS